MKRSLGVLKEELAQLEDGNPYTVDSGINTDELDSPPPHHFRNNSKSVSSSTQCVLTDFEPSETKENIPVNEIMSQALLVERIFRPEETLGFQLANTALSRHSVGTDTDDMINFSVKTSTVCNEMTQHNSNVLSSLENISCHGNNKRNSMSCESKKVVMVSEGTSTDNSVNFTGHYHGEIVITGNHDHHLENDASPQIAEERAIDINHKDVQTTNKIHETNGITSSRKKSFNNAATQFEILPSNESNTNTCETPSSETTPILHSIEILPNSDCSNLADYHFERIVDKTAEYTTTDISIIDSKVCLDHSAVENVKQTLLQCNNQADEKIFKEMPSMISKDDEVENAEVDELENRNASGLSNEIIQTPDKNSNSTLVETEIVMEYNTELEQHPVHDMMEKSHDTITVSNDTDEIEKCFEMLYVDGTANNGDNDLDMCNNDDSNQMSNIIQTKSLANGDKSKVREKFVDELHDYLFENMDTNSGVTDSISGPKKQVSDCKREIDFDNIPPKEGMGNIVEVNAVDIIDKNGIPEINLNNVSIKNSDVDKNVISIESDYVIVVDNKTLIEEEEEEVADGINTATSSTCQSLAEGTAVCETGVTSSASKREICVQTDKMCLGNDNNIPAAITERNLKAYLPPESDEEERERFMNRFCYSASQHLQTGDADFEYKEAKYMTANPAEDGLYQGCLVYLTDTESVSDYSEMSEDSVFSDFNHHKCSSDSEYDETVHAKLLMENIKNKYEMLLSDFDLVASERSRLQGETRKRSCYDLLSNFKTALEEELLKLDDHHSGRSSTSDSAESRACFSPLHSSGGGGGDIQKNSSIDILSPAKTKSNLLPFGRTSPDGAQQKTPSKHHKLIESLDENNNNHNRNNTKNNSNQNKLQVHSVDDLRTKLCSPEKLINEKTHGIKPQTSPKFDRFRASPLHSTPATHRSSKSLDGTPDTLAAYSNIHSPLYNRSLSLQDRRGNDDIFGSRFGEPKTEHEKLKRELMLTKLEKSRLEAVLSCVLLTNDIELPNESSLKNLTLSRSSTLSSSTSMAQLQKLSRSSSPFQVWVL